MSRSRSKRHDWRNSKRCRVGDTEDDISQSRAAGSKSRTATVYDAVAGKVGLNGFLTEEQFDSARLLPSQPEHVLLRRVNAPDEVTDDFYNADECLEQDQRLPDSDLLKAVHSYASDFYAATSEQPEAEDYRTFNGSALLLLGILMEEASAEALGENGDMALCEPEQMGNQMLTSAMAEHQVRGRVEPRKIRLQSDPWAEEMGDVEDLKSRTKRRKKS